MPAHAAAQAAGGALVGNVHDESGGAVPGATIAATETRTNISRTAVSNAAGNYTLTNLSPGSYRVEGELVGFRKFSRDNVEVNVNSTIRVDISLTVGELEESVTVIGRERRMLQTDRADTGRIIESKADHAEIPLSFNRNFQGLMVTVPGAHPPLPSTLAVLQLAGQPVHQRQRAAAPREQRHARRLSDNNHNVRVGLPPGCITPSADAIEAVKRQHEQLRRGVGRAGGAVTNVTLKSGTNRGSRAVAFFFGNPKEQHPAQGHPGTESRHPSYTRAVRAGRRRPDPEEQGLLLRRLARARATTGTCSPLTQHPARGLPQRQLQPGDHLSSTTPPTGNPDGTGRQPFPGNHHSGQPHQPHCPQLTPRQHPDAEHSRRAVWGQINYEQPVRAGKAHEPVRRQNSRTRQRRTAARCSVTAIRMPKTKDPVNVRHLGRCEGLFGNGSLTQRTTVAINYNRVWSSSAGPGSPCGAERPTITWRSPRPMG